jgi:hypothetical protein
VVMLAYARSPAFLARAHFLLALVGADAPSQALPKLHWLLRRLCSNMLDPPHSLHLLFWRLLGHHHALQHRLVPVKGHPRADCEELHHKVPSGETV